MKECNECRERSDYRNVPIWSLLEDGVIVVATLSFTNIVLRALVLCDGHLLFSMLMTYVLI